MLNPTVISQLSSPPLSPLSAQQEQVEFYHSNKRNSTSSTSSNSSNGSNNGKPRSRFSNMEDTIICEGVAKGLTWGQISGQLPHRKRATCFNRYRTLQGIRKSRKRSLPDMRSPPTTPPNSSVWLPSTPPSKEQERHHPYHYQRRHSMGHHHHEQQFPVLVAPLPTRLPLPFSYAERTR